MDETHRDSATQDSANDDTKWKELHGGLVAKMRLEKLHEAMKYREKEWLQTAINEAKEGDINRESEILFLAEMELETLNVKEELKEAVREKNPGEIRTIINKITTNRQYHSRLQQDVAEAARELGQIERILGLGSVLMDMDRKTMGEMSRYSHPPVLVHRVLQAVMLLFKDDEERTEKWSICQRAMQPNGPHGMIRKVLDFEPNSVHPEIAARADQLLKRIDLLKVQEVSAGAATFYVWARGVIERVVPKGSGTTVQPADVKRQKELFSPLPASPRRRRKHAPRAQYMTSPRK